MIEMMLLVLLWAFVLIRWMLRGQGFRGRDSD
jgi:hypothetical protein